MCELKIVSSKILIGAFGNLWTLDLLGLTLELFPAIEYFNTTSFYEIL